MPIEVKGQDVVIKLVEQKLKQIEDRFEPALQDEVTRLIARTQQGRDVDNQPFAPYSAGYAETRRAAGRRPSPPDLTFTGQMLNAIQTRVDRAAGKLIGTVFFSSAREAAKASGNQRLRRFFAFGKEQVERLKRKLEGK